MSILSDVDLLSRFSNIIVSNRERSLINPASIDIRVGTTLKEEKAASEWKDIPFANYSSDYYYQLMPGAFVLVATLEEIHIPNGFVGELKLKSSCALSGYDHSNAGYIDPGWRGIITMELRNNSRYTTLPLYPEMRVAQLVLHTLVRAAKNPYTGKYQHAKSVESAKP